MEKAFTSKTDSEAHSGVLISGWYSGMGTSKAVMGGGGGNDISLSLAVCLTIFKKK